MKFTSAMIVVQDMEKSRKFYENLLNQKVLLDLGANVSYEGFALMDFKRWMEFLEKEESDFSFLKSNVYELYFEIDDYDNFIEKLNNFKDFEVEIAHKTKEFPWGQRVIRFYDPDNHMVEVGESLESVANKFHSDGMSVEEIAKRMGIPEENVVNLVNI